MAGGEVEIVALTKRFDDVEAVAGIDLHIPSGEFFSHPRAVRLRQDHDAPPGGRIRAADQREHLPRRRRRGRPAAPQAQRQHRLPELRPVPVPVGGRQRRLRAPLPETGQGRVGPPGRRRPRAGPAPRLREAPAGPALRRPTAAGGPGPGPRPQPGRPAPRRAARRARRQAAPDPAGRAEGPPGDGGHHLPLRHPRPGGGPHHVRPAGRHGGGQGGPGGHAGRGLRGAGRRLRGRLPRSLQPDGRATPAARVRTARARSASASSTWPPSRARPTAPGRSSWPSAPSGWPSSLTGPPVPTGCRPWWSGWSSSGRPPR